MEYLLVLQLPRAHVTTSFSCNLHYCCAGAVGIILAACFVAPAKPLYSPPVFCVSAPEVSPYSRPHRRNRPSHRRRRRVRGRGAWSPFAWRQFLSSVEL